jgi:hypothetical protein
VGPADVRELARDVPARWRELDLVHREPVETFEVTLRHGELDGVRLPGRQRVRERGAPPSSWSVRDLEPFPTNYAWSAMLDPYELTTGVVMTEVRRDELFGRPVVRFVARAVEGYDPVCSCCPLVLSEVSKRLEHGETWASRPGDLPDGVELALDLEVGIVVSSRDLGGRHPSWFTNELRRVA